MPRIPAYLSKNQPLTATAFQLTLTRSGNRRFAHFHPGQYATISFPNQSALRGERSFSIISTPQEQDELSFGIRVGGTYTSALRDLPMNEPAIVAGPFGQFTFDPSRDQSAVFLAGGIGITPFLSMIRSATRERLPNELLLLYCVRTLSDVPFRQELDRLAQINPHFRIVYVVSDGKIDVPSNQFVAGRINRELLWWSLNADPWRRSYFVCGPPPFMKSATGIIRSFGIPFEAVRGERFSVGSTDIIERGSPIPKYVFAAWGTAAAVLFGVIIRSEQAKRSSAASVVSGVTNSASNGVSTNQGTSSTVSPSGPTSQSQNFSLPIQPRTRVS